MANKFLCFNHLEIQVYFLRMSKQHMRIKLENNNEFVDHHTEKQSKY